MSYGLSEEVVQKVREVFKAYPSVEKAVLYGSRAMGNFRTGSDIDITLIGQGLDIQILSKIDNDLDNLLTPYTFDVSLYDSISNDALKDHIARVGIEFYKKGI